MKYLKQDMRINKLATLIVLICLLGGARESFAQTVLPTNSTPEGAAVAPTGWTIIFGSTDISNKDYWAGWAAYPWEDSPDNPPNGHLRWVSGWHNEAVATTITDLVVDVSYTMSFYMAEMRSDAGGTPTLYDGILRATVGGVDYLYPLQVERTIVGHYKH